MSRRSAPRRTVLRAYKTGGRATTVWHHELDCGHIERRKRRAPATMIGCLRCEAGTTIARVAPLSDDSPVINLDASIDTDAAIVRARLAATLNVPADAITVQTTLNRVAGALVFLEPAQIATILNRPVT